MDFINFQLNYLDKKTFSWYIRLLYCWVVPSFVAQPSGGASGYDKQILQVARFLSSSPKPIVRQENPPSLDVQCGEDRYLQNERSSSERMVLCL